MSPNLDYSSLIAHCSLLVSTWDSHISQWVSSFGGPWEELLRLILAGVAGGLVGLEREIRGRQAGFRTYLLVCMGSALVMIVSVAFAAHRWIPQTPNQGVNINVDPARIAYGVMTGVGFLGAGTILHTKGAVRGLTTAAGLWCVAAVGLAAGFGMYTIAVLATLLVVLSLSALNYLEDFLPRTRYRTVTLRIPWHVGCITEIVQLFRGAGLKVMDADFERIGDLSHADVHLMVGFTNAKQYYDLAHKLEGDQTIKLI